MLSPCHHCVGWLSCHFFLIHSTGATFVGTRIDKKSFVALLTCKDVSLAGADLSKLDLSGMDLSVMTGE